jgi:PD-(D/E)XK endonuclease
MFVLDSNSKGAVAEQAIVLEAFKLGVPVLRPLAEHGRCDLALDLGGRLWRVQCKWGNLSSERDVIKVHLTTSRCTPNGYVYTTYSPEEIDLFGVFCGELDRCFLLPGALGVGRRAIWLRLTPARNNQSSCINLADDFAFEGAIAQLGERRSGRPKVTGSSPVSSTSSSPEDRLRVVSANHVRDRFGYWIDRAAAGDDIVVTRHGKARVRITAELTPLIPSPRTPHTPP